MKIRNNMGPRTLTWGTPALTGRGDERVQRHLLSTRVEEVTNPRVELALDSTGRQCGEQGRMPDCMKDRDMSGETALISCLILRSSIHSWGSRSSMSKVE